MGSAGSTSEGWSFGGVSRYVGTLLIGGLVGLVAVLVLIAATGWGDPGLGFWAGVGGAYGMVGPPNSR